MPKLILTDKSTDFDFGVSHGDEIFTMFFQQNLEPLKTEAERAMTQKIIKLW